MVTHRGYSCSSITEDGSANTLPKQISSYRFRGEFIYDCGGRLPRCLKPGGLLGVESFASDRDAKQRKPVDIDPAELLRTVLSSSFRVLRFEDVEGVSDWTLAKTRLARLIAQKM